MKKSFKLVDNIYPADQAKEVLISIFTDKIKSLDRMIFQQKVMLGEESPHFAQRVEELRATRREILSLMNHLEAEEQTVSITANVELQLIEQPSSI